MDVKALYKHVPNNEGIAAVKQKHDNYTKKTAATKVITTFLALILTLNNFIFNSKFYFQIKGCAMGTICAPTYTNMFMSEFEERYIYPLIKNKSSSYLRFIGDIFMVWTKSENKLKSIINEINKKHHSIKFDFKFSKEKFEFLDTLVYKDHGTTCKQQLPTKKAAKKTDRQSYLHAKSAHPLSLKKSIPYSQALRIKRFCSTFDKYKKHSNDLVKRLVEKGYKENIIRNQIEKDNLKRSTLLNKTNAVRKNVIPFSVTYSPTLPNIREIILSTGIY